MRSLPDIYKAPTFYLYVEDTVQIPDAPEEAYLPRRKESFIADIMPKRLPTQDWADIANPEDEAGAAEGGAEAGGTQDALPTGTERRRTDRRKGGRRAEDVESLDNLVRLYKERLAQTKEELYEEIAPSLQDELERQVSAHQDELQRQMIEHQAALQQKMVEHQDAQQRQLEDHQADLQAQILEARQEAYQDELLEKREAISEAVAYISRGMRDIEEGFAGFVREFSDELKFMALDIAERILNKEIDEDAHALEALVLQQVSEIKNAPWINVEVSDQIKGLAGHLKEQLERAEQGKQFFVESRDVPPDTVRIVTEEGVVDATLSIQIKQLREAFIRAGEEGE